MIKIKIQGVEFEIEAQVNWSDCEPYEENYSDMELLWNGRVYTSLPEYEEDDKGLAVRDDNGRDAFILVIYPTA